MKKHLYLSVVLASLTFASPAFAQMRGVTRQEHPAHSVVFRHHPVT